MTQTDPDSGAVTTSTYDAANRLLTSEDASGITTYSYDANGNQLTIEEPSGDVTTNSWDGENRLVQVEHPDSSVTTYAYNGDGLKVEKDDGVEVTRFLYDGNNLLRESDDVGTLEAELTYVPQPYAQLVSQQRDGASSFYHFDGIKNASELSDSGGVVTDEYAHDAWGVPRSTSGYTANAHTYKGQLVAYYGDPHAGPEESIYSLHHRDYVAQQGRFRSEDPAEDDLNDYRPVHNNPVNAEDPSGLTGAVGHHPLPVSVIGKISGYLTNEARDLALGYYSGRTDPDHLHKTYGGVSHRKYNRLVHQEFEAWRLKNGFTTRRKVSATELKEFIDGLVPDRYQSRPIGLSKHLRQIWDFNDAILRERAARLETTPAKLGTFRPTGSVEDLIALGRKYDDARLVIAKAKARKANGRRRRGAASGDLIVAGVGTAALGTAIEYLALYPYEQLYLQDLGEKAKANLEAISLYNIIRSARNSGTFPDVFGTPVPSDEELRRGVTIDLILKGSLNEALGWKDPQSDIKTLAVYENLIIHIVERDGQLYLQVQQMMPAGHEPRVRTILTPETRWAGGQAGPVLDRGRGRPGGP